MYVCIIRAMIKIGYPKFSYSKKEIKKERRKEKKKERKKKIKNE